MKLKLVLFSFLLMASVYLAGCQQKGIPKEALMPTYVTTEQRSLQTRQYDTLNEKEILAATAGVLQDLGFTLEESETELGLITANKARDATESGQVAGAVFMTVMFGTQFVHDKEQKIRVSVVTKKALDGSKKTSVRVTFQRLIWDNRGILTKMETLEDPEMYQGFFEKLSKAVFLEGNKI